MTFKDLEDWQKELAVKNLKDGENNNHYVEVIAEKVTFLSAKSNETGDNYER